MNNILLKDFLQLNLGQWLTLRTSYFPARNRIHTHRSNALLKIYRQSLYNQGLDSACIYRKNIEAQTTDVYCGINQSNISSTYYLQQINNWISFLNKANHISHVYKTNKLTVFEQSWLVNPNLRLNINTIYKQDRCVCISFSSDIKIV
uniref:Uncharacterized protein n=1 Tax=Izziella formosana TaxID=1653389 RepID=A0A1G4NUK4_9FLOR|nr:Hypothetical protein ycf58 [Izziella formosana]SCW22352.1 Hypothetical protein ycf58 [Izziella formosana]